MGLIKCVFLIFRSAPNTFIQYISSPSLFHLTTKLLRNSFYSLLIFQLIFSPSIALAKETPKAEISYSIFQPKDITLNAEDFLKSDNQFNENEKVFIEKYFNEPARVTLDLMILARALSEKAGEIADTISNDKTLGTEHVKKMIQSRDQDQEIKVEIPGLGKAEFNSLGYKDEGKIFTRFIHYGTNTSYVFVDTNIININALSDEEKELLGDKVLIQKENRKRSGFRSELDRYIALQQMHTPVRADETYDPFPDLSQIKPDEAKSYLEALLEDAKSNPPPKKYDKSKDQESGRLVKVIFYDGKEQVVQQIKSYARYKELSSLEKISIYWRSVKQGTRLNWDYWDHDNILQKPLSFITGDAMVSIISTVAQVGIFAALKQSLDPISLMLVGGWAFAFSITPTARNWINVNPSKSAVIFKSFLNSVTFNYLLMVAMFGFDSIFSLSLATLGTHFVVITNALINNFGKVWWYKIPQMRQRAGLTLKEINILGLKTKVDQSSLEQQLWYFGSNIIRTADLIGLGALFTVLGIDFTWSRIVMLLSIPTMHYFIMKYANKKDFKEKSVLNEEWQRVNYLHWNRKPVLYKGKKIPIFYMGAVKIFAEESMVVFKNLGGYWISKKVLNLLYPITKATSEFIKNIFLAQFDNEFGVRDRVFTPDLQRPLESPLTRSCQKIFL